MDTKKQKAKGTAEKVAGSVKKAAGKAVGNESLQAEGKGQKTKGEARKDVAKNSSAIQNW